MSHGPNDHGIVDLTCKLGELEISIKGPAAKAAKLLQKITQLDSASSPRGSESSAASFAVVSKPGQGSSARLETRQEIEASFAPCPEHLLSDGHRLAGGPLSGPDRVRRAWLAGKWASAVERGRASSPNALPHLPLRSRFYAVLRADRLPRPTIFRSARSYWQCVGELARSNSISHSFPSEQEAKVYLLGAGVSNFDILA